jgi:type I restriction enzyme S subunit
MSAHRLTAIGDLVKPISWWSPERDDPDGVFMYIDLSAVDQDAKVITGARELSCTEAPSRARQLVRAGDVLVSTVRPNLNGIARVPAKFDGATASTGFCVLRPKTGSLNSDFLFHWVKSPRFVSEMVRRATGASYPAVSDRIVYESKLPLPPLAEQRRIAEILDKADALRAMRHAALAQLDTLTQSMFLEMFGDPVANSRNWPVVLLGDHTSKIGSGATPLGGEAAYKSAGVALIRSMNVRDAHFSRDGLAFIDDQQAARLDGVIVEPDDVLLNITGASVARVCRAPREVLPARVNQHVAIIRPTVSFEPRFLEQCLLFPSMKRRLLRIAGAGATREAITKDAIERLIVIWPPRKEQERFAQKVLAREGLGVVQGRHQGAADALFASLQHRAFRGEL